MLDRMRFCYFFMIQELEKKKTPRRSPVVYCAGSRTCRAGPRPQIDKRRMARNSGYWVVSSWPGTPVRVNTDATHITRTCCRRPSSLQRCCNQLLLLNDVAAFIIFFPANPHSKLNAQPSVSISFVIIARVSTPDP